MRRQQGNEASPSIIHTSSIALLQERFRNLQKVKEMREGREMQRVHSSGDSSTDHRAAGSSSALSHLAAGAVQQAANSDEQLPRWFLHPDLVRPSRPLQGPSYHSHSLGGGINGVQAASPTTPGSPWADVPRMQNSGYRGDVDVDTSLHL